MRPVRRRPYALGNYDSGDGLGQSVTGQDVANIASLAAGLISNPDATLARQGPRIVAALDTHIVGPAIRTTIRRYVVPYFGPPMIVLYVLSGMSMWASYKVLQEFRAGKLKANRGRRRKR
jgi:hypothetical protein